MFLCEDLCMTRFGRLASPGQSDREGRTFGPQPPPRADPQWAVINSLRELPTCRRPLGTSIPILGVGHLAAKSRVSNCLLYTCTTYGYCPTSKPPCRLRPVSCASTQPFIGASDEFRHRRRRGIVAPAKDESLQLPPVLLKASASTARGNHRVCFQLLSAYASQRTLCFWL